MTTLLDAKINFFRDCLDRNVPYWGTVIQTMASPVERLSFLADLVRRLNRGERDLRILEIGAFAGASAITLAKSIEKYHAGAGKVYCVDPWRRKVGNTCMDLGILRDKNGRDLASYTYEDMFRYNIRAAGVENMVVAMKGFSRDVLPILAEEQFDLIYVDGDHSHAGARFDIEKSMPLVRQGGYLCGDDLEMQIPDIPASCIKPTSECVFNGITFHSGVTLAIHEVFGRKISVADGLWAQQKTKDNSVPLKISWMDVADIGNADPDWVTPMFTTFFNQAVARLCQKALECKWKTAVLYGAGRHTRRLVQFLNNTNCIAMNFSGVVDDAISQGNIGALPILTRDQALQSKPDVIVLSSDTQEDALANSAAEWRRNIPVFRLYGVE